MEKFCGTKINCNLLAQLDGSLVWPKPFAQVISLEKFRSYQLIYENCETFHLKRFAICSRLHMSPDPCNGLATQDYDFSRSLYNIIQFILKHLVITKIFYVKHVS